MARSINKVTLIGTLGRDPETRFMPNGNAVANINIATDESYTDRGTGQRVEQTEWHRIVVYGKLAEICQQYLRKGSRAYFEGRLKTREWEKDGIKRYTTEIIANDMMMLDRASDSTYQPQTAGNTYQQPAPQQHAQPMAQPTAQPQQAMQQPMANTGYNAGGYQQQPAYAPQQQAAPQPMAQPQQPMAQQPPAQPTAPAPQAPAAAPAPQNNFDSFDDDIPF